MTSPLYRFVFSLILGGILSSVMDGCTTKDQEALGSLPIETSTPTRDQPQDLYLDPQIDHDLDQTTRQIMDQFTEMRVNARDLGAPEGLDLDLDLAIQPLPDLETDLGSQRSQELALVDDQAWNELLPEPDCLIWDRGTQQCLMYRSESAQESCERYTETLNGNLTRGELTDLESCRAPALSLSALEQAERYLNYVRSRSGTPPLSVNSSVTTAECAFIYDWISRRETWDERSSCYSEIDLPFDLLSEISVLQRAWTLRDSIALELESMSYGNSMHRDTLLAPHTREAQWGLSSNISCFTTTEETPSHTSQNLFTFYPGVGHVPFELVHSGNHQGEQVPWSLSFHDESIRIRRVKMFNLSDPSGDSRRSLDIDILPSSNGLDHSDHHIQWSFRDPLFVQQIVMTEVEFVSESEGSQKLSLYTALNGCGTVMPRQCDPRRHDECVAPGFACTYVPSDPAEWLCRREGPLDEGQECSDHSLSCQNLMLCLYPEANIQNRYCTSICLNDPASVRPCDSYCLDNSLRLETLASYEVGACFP